MKGLAWCIVPILVLAAAAAAACDSSKIELAYSWKRDLSCGDLACVTHDITGTVANHCDVPVRISAAFMAVDGNGALLDRIEWSLSGGAWLGPNQTRSFAIVPAFYGLAKLRDVQFELYPPTVR